MYWACSDAPSTKLSAGLLSDLIGVPVESRLLDILVCPVCKGKLIYRPVESELICRFDRLGFPIRDEIPIMLESDARAISLEELDSLPTHSAE